MKYLLNKDLRRNIIDAICKAKDGHIPSSFSIVDIINYLYDEILNINPKNIDKLSRDFFILSKGHGAVALYVVLKKFNFISQKQLDSLGNKNSILGGHPDMTKVPGAEASTGSLGHGFPTAVGIAMGLKIKGKNNKVIALLGDGECQEGTIWESANIATNNKLGNLTAIVDWNGSAAQLMPIDDLPSKWKSFGFNVLVINGHKKNELNKIKSFISKNSNMPKAIIAKNIKGKGVSFLEGHGKWHHKLPNKEEYIQIMSELNDN